VVQDTPGKTAIFKQLLVELRPRRRQVRPGAGTLSAEQRGKRLGGILHGCQCFWRRRIDLRRKRCGGSTCAGVIDQPARLDSRVLQNRQQLVDAQDPADY
jgi:hypothetical protein